MVWLQEVVPTGNKYITSGSNTKSISIITSS